MVRVQGTMLELTLGPGSGEAKTVLCLGAHCDDIEIGCGATLLRFAEEYPAAEIRWVVFSSDARRAAETSRAAKMLFGQEHRTDIVFKEFRNSFFPYIGLEIKEYFEQLKREIQPEVIFTHYRQDLHQDHRVISDLTWTTFRESLILEYEVPKYDGDIGQPNFFVPISERFLKRKVEMLMRCFETQAKKHWFSPETFTGLMRLRGIECRAADGYAEGFHCRKIVLTGPSRSGRS